MDQDRAILHLLSPLRARKPVKAVPSHVLPAMAPEEAFRAILSDCLAQISANAANLRVERGAEGLHQLRVAFRRLEVALGAFGREFGQDWLEELRSRAKTLSRRFGAARELDVFVEEMLEAVPGKNAPAFAALKARAQVARDTAWREVQTTLRSPAFERFTDDVAGLAQSRVPLTRPRKLIKTAAGMLDRQARRVKKRGRAARSQDDVDLHRLRIALKKLRYTAEFFAPLYPKVEVKRYLRQVKDLQEQLGVLNDAAHVRRLVTGLLPATRKKGKADLHLAADTVIGWYEAQAPKGARRALRRYDRLRKLKPYWR